MERDVPSAGHAEALPVDANQRQGPVLRVLPLDEIAPPMWSARSNWESPEAVELKASIKQHGGLQPIVVRPVDSSGQIGTTYEVVAGELRRVGAVEAGYTVIPAVVVDCDFALGVEIALIGNINRADLTPLDHGAYLLTLKEARDLSTRELAASVGRSKSWVNERIQLLQLPDDLQAMVSERPDTATHARELAKVADEEKRGKFVARVLGGALPLAALRQEIAEITGGERASRRPNGPAAKRERTAAGSESRGADGLLSELQCIQREVLGMQVPAVEITRQKLYKEIAETVSIMQRAMDKLQRAAA